MQGYFRMLNSPWLLLARCSVLCSCCQVYKIIRYSGNSSLKTLQTILIKKQFDSFKFLICSGWRTMRSSWSWQIVQTGVESSVAASNIANRTAASNPEAKLLPSDSYWPLLTVKSNCKSLIKKNSLSTDFCHCFLFELQSPNAKMLWWWGHHSSIIDWSNSRRTSLHSFLCTIASAFLIVYFIGVL